MTIKLLDITYLFLIAVGIIIICILVYLRFLTNRAFKTVLMLINENKECDYDLHRFLQTTEGLLKNAKIEDLFYRIIYLGNCFEKKKNNDKNAVQQNIERADYAVNIGIIPKSSRGENRYIHLMILQTMILLIEMDILIKIKAINETFYNFSKLQTFILHDIKNIAQFSHTLSYNLEHAENPDRELKLIGILKKSAPVLSLRANRILDMLEIGKERGYPDSQKSNISVKRLIETVANFYKFPYEIQGDASIYTEVYRITSILDNILKNIYEKTLREHNVQSCIDIIKTEEDIKITVRDTGSHIEHIERIFEPFYTTKKEGLGIGLFQAKSIALSMGGEIISRNIEGGVEFEVTIPLK
jgi:signal transduction histidine kinase